MSNPTVAEYWGFDTIPHHRNTYMGLELEAEDYRGEYGDRVLRHWNILGDASLRNDGVEFVLKDPTRGEDLQSAILELFQHLEDNRVVLSHRCSLHVHLDMRNKRIEDIEKLYRLYVLFEPALYHVGQKDRYENIYCPGLTHATEQVKQAAQAFSAKYLDNLVDYGCKYTGFNFLPLTQFGTVEIRTHSGSLRANEVSDWVRVLQAIITFSERSSMEQVKALSSMSVDEAVRAVWPDWHLRELIACPSLYRYWENAKLNLLYMDIIDKTLLLDDGQKQRNLDEIINMNILQPAIDQAIEDSDICVD